MHLDWNSICGRAQRPPLFIALETNGAPVFTIFLSRFWMPRDSFEATRPEFTARSVAFALLADHRSLLKREGASDETCIIPESRCWGPGAAGPPRALSGVSGACLWMCVSAFPLSDHFVKDVVQPCCCFANLIWHKQTCKLLFSYITGVSAGLGLVLAPD